MQTILGSGGSIGTDLAKELVKFTDNIRLVSRNPQKVNENDELLKADLLDSKSVSNAIEGSDVVYLVAGFPYKTKTWQSHWPRAMDNVIIACKEHESKLVFFDNIYMYDPDFLSQITEATPINPPSKKGSVRAQIAQMVMDEVKKGTLEALIARAPDFYGPGINNAVMNEAVVKPLKSGKAANWFCSVDKIHSFIWTPDAAKATAMLGNDENAFGQVWHLPTASNPMTGKQYIEAIAMELGVKPKFRVAGKGLVKVMGWFNPMMKELVEMLYQYDRDYKFDSSKFTKTFHFEPITYTEGIKQMVAFEMKS